MQVVNKKMCVVVILVLVIIESCTLFLMYKSYGNKNTSLDEVNLSINNSNMFAIMLEQDDGTYKEDTSSAWPTSGYEYNESMSGCIDINGNKLDGVLSYDATNNIATVDTGATSYCYLYFSKPKSAPETILEGEKNITFTLEGGLYRYQGTQEEVDNNYICFGTYDKNTCVNDTNTYMYRIIGVTEENQMKLIKKESLKSLVKWWDNLEENVVWPDSLMYSDINRNLFLSNEKYVTSGWENKLATTDWKYGDTINDIYILGEFVSDYDGDKMYEYENQWTNLIPAKIGLMYIHDYYYAYKSGIPGNSNNAKTSWIHLSHNDSNAPSEFEAFMTRFGLYIYGPWYEMYYIDSYGNVNSAGLNNQLSVRPVFYLINDIEITGAGTIDDPFIIK